MPSEARKAGEPRQLRIPLELISLTNGTLKIKLGLHKMEWNGKELWVKVIAR